MSFIAPQAYTKETLAKAFDWLQHQPANVKQVATSPDVLVGLYLKAQRQGFTNIDADAPVSSKRFIDDLKNLKKDFAIFDEPRNQAMSVPVVTPVVEVAEPTVVTPQGASAGPTTSYTMTSIQQTQTFQQTSINTNDLNLDETTKEHLVTIQKRFNLSSPQEALRMAVSVGAQHITRWL